jgi:hypothetical protein
MWNGKQGVVSVLVLAAGRNCTLMFSDPFVWHQELLLAKITLLALNFPPLSTGPVFSSTPPFVLLVRWHASCPLVNLTGLGVE